jgi:hypothetical protein
MNYGGGYGSMLGDDPRGLYKCVFAPDRSNSFESKKPLSFTLAQRRERRAAPSTTAHGCDNG